MISGCSGGCSHCSDAEMKGTILSWQRWTISGPSSCCPFWRRLKPFWHLLAIWIPAFRQFRPWERSSNIQDLPSPLPPQPPPPNRVLRDTGPVTLSQESTTQEQRMILVTIMLFPEGGVVILYTRLDGCEENLGFTSNSDARNPPKPRR